MISESDEDWVEKRKEELKQIKLKDIAINRDPNNINLDKPAQDLKSKLSSDLSKFWHKPEISLLPYCGSKLSSDLSRFWLRQTHYCWRYASTKISSSLSVECSRAL